ncbi:branched-chain amino acid transport system permease protein [Desulfosalsimonas propionicica]|uniref:Branched-chain amino acid transport system permease protein n=1 Tax=Desulfosalsimonas propionicica TaxID=332175 RepID=A0A7W0C9U9_9BACT|nr:branched-chain amino acid ABC transporter permease [Desulfosalsimonas propionicica]MBA2881739.1 branched-chain amino acid transport system permease protein [Desulfosalsimonas propionicica]
MDDKYLPAIYTAFALGIAFLGWRIDNAYYLQLLIFIGLNTLLALSLNMLMGYAGQISLGHAAFYGIGAYVTAILTTTYQVPPLLALPAAVGAAMVIAWIVGMPTLRLSGYYLGMGTLGFGMIVHIVLREWGSLTGGASGFVGIPPLKIGPVSFASSKSYFFLVWAVVLAMIILCRRIIDSRVGRALCAIHDGEKAAAAVGVNTRRLKLQVFVLSAGIAALAGFLYAHLIFFISPGSFGFMASIKIVTMVVIGGMASIWGALFGASLLTLLPEWLHAFSEFEMVIYGLILMVVMIFMPRGLTRGLVDIYERYRKTHDRQ